MGFLSQPERRLGKDAGAADTRLEASRSWGLLDSAPAVEVQQGVFDGLPLPILGLLLQWSCPHRPPHFRFRNSNLGQLFQLVVCEAWASRKILPSHTPCSMVRMSISAPMLPNCGRCPHACRLSCRCRLALRLLGCWKSCLPHDAPR